MATFSLVAEAAAPPAVVFEVLTDHRGYPELSRIRSVMLEREGEPPPNGVGAIRVLKSVGPPLREEVIAYEPHSCFAYKLLSGAPMRDHTGTVELSETPKGTRIEYRIDTTPALPLAGGLLMSITRRLVGQLLKGLVDESERRALVVK